MKEPRPRHSILVPVDFSEHSRAALRRACAVAQMLGDDVALLHVMDTGRAPEAASEARLEETRLQLRALAAEADPAGASIKIVEVLEGRPGQVVLRVAESVSPRLIVMGKRGDGPSSVGCGSVAERVVRGASCDVLVVRDPSSQEASTCRDRGGGA